MTLLARHRLGLLAELAVVLLLNFTLVNATQWLTGLLHLPFPELILLRHAYMYFVLTIAVASWVVLRGESLADLGLVVPKRWLVLIGRALLLFVAIVVFEVIASAFIDPIIVRVTGTHANMGEQYFASLKGNFGLFLYILPFTWVFGGLGEELLFRGFVMTRIAQVLGDGRAAWIAAVVLQGFVFALGHGYQGPVGMFGAGMIGIIYAVGTVAWGRNLWPAIVAHGLFDSFAFFLMYTGIIHA